MKQERGSRRDGSVVQSTALNPKGLADSEPTRGNGKWSISIILLSGCCHKLYDIMSNRNITVFQRADTYQKTLYKKSSKVAHRQKLIAILLSQSSCTGILDISYHERFFFF